MSDYGFRVSKEGFDVLTEADDKNMSITSKLNALKEYVAGNTTVATDGSGNATKTIAHNLSYIPQFFAFAKYDDGTWYPTNSNIMQTVTYADSTNIYIKVLGMSASTTYSLYYIIFHDEVV